MSIHLAQLETLGLNRSEVITVWRGYLKWYAELQLPEKQYLKSLPRDLRWDIVFETVIKILLDECHQSRQVVTVDADEFALFAA